MDDFKFDDLNKKQLLRVSSVYNLDIDPALSYNEILDKIKDLLKIKEDGEIIIKEEKEIKEGKEGKGKEGHKIIIKILN